MPDRSGAALAAPSSSPVPARGTAALSARLPAPSDPDQARSRELQARIAAGIRAAGGFWRFDQYQQACLYEPGLGYYSGPRSPFGRGGDFVTAPELGPLFARTLARPLVEALAVLGPQAELLEFGGGTGALAAELLAELTQLKATPARYRILEVSGTLRALQAAHLSEALGPTLEQNRGPAGAERVEWLTALPSGFTGVVIANEVLDAMPVRRFIVTSEGPRELGVALNAAGEPDWAEDDPDDALLARISALEHELGPLPAGLIGEWNPWLDGWMRALAAAMTAGEVFLIDYGYPRRDYYRVDRPGGTLDCVYRQHRHGDPFLWPGLCDRSAQVEWDAVAEAAEAAGFAVHSWQRQAEFLLAHGLPALYEQAFATADAVGQVRLAQEGKQLLLPQAMGERFQVLRLQRTPGAAAPT